MITGIDPRCFVVGWSGNDDGHAGLGLKDALAILLRENANITILTHFQKKKYQYQFSYRETGVMSL